eukprot:scaffold1203_cov117-Cylindrotheca_fusiformis.AAC.11
MGSELLDGYVRPSTGDRKAPADYHFQNEQQEMSPTAATRTKALSLYRKLLRGAMKMPTPNRQNFVIRKTRTEFKASKDLTDPDAINNAIRLADTNLDSKKQDISTNKVLKQSSNTVLFTFQRFWSKPSTLQS